MATSASTNFSQNRDQVSSDALQLLGVIGAGESATANDLAFCSNILNKMLKGWQAQGIHVWKETEAVIPIVQGQSTYTLNSINYPNIGRPFSIINCRYRYNNGSLERLMRCMGRTEFMSLPTKTSSEGPATCWFYTPQLSDGLLYVWPVPQDTDDALAFSYVKVIEDMDSASDDFDFPQEWLGCITYNLAVQIAPAFGITLSKINPDIIQTAATMLLEMQTWDVNQGSVRICPNYRND